MLARVQSFILSGIDASLCEIEVDVAEYDTKGDVVVGLAAKSVGECLERVKSALLNAGYSPPRGRLLVNLAPGDVRKEGPAYDLPIAIGLLIGDGVVRIPSAAAQVVVRMGATKVAVPAGAQGASTGTSGGANTGRSAMRDHDGLDARRFLFAGELALDGRLRPVRGVIAMAHLAREKGFAGVIVPAENAREAAVVPGIDVHAVRTLPEVVGLLNGAIEPSPHALVDVASLIEQATAAIDFADVRGQEMVKRAITVAAAGHHNILMLGPPGTGKTMMAKALPGVMPALTPEEAIEITRIYSAAGATVDGGSESAQGLITLRPVRSPHHTASMAAIIGGGSDPTPGEISLAHRGVLFLDELPEFPRPVLETLRQPLEDHHVTISRANAKVKFPAQFMLVAAMNPTPKGTMPGREDMAGRREMERYLSRISGPLIDRIDIHVEAPAVPWKQLSAPGSLTAEATGGAPGASAGIMERDGRDGASTTSPERARRDAENRGSSSAQIRARVSDARERQRARQGASPNARLSGKELDRLAPLDEAGRTMLGQAMQELGLSARAYDKIRRVARTIADLEGSENVRVEHIAEAVGYRLLDRKV